MMNFGLGDDLACSLTPFGPWTLHRWAWALQIQPDVPLRGKEAASLGWCTLGDVRVLMDALELVEDGTPLWRDDSAFPSRHWNFHLGHCAPRGWHHAWSGMTLHWAELPCGWWVGTLLSWNMTSLVRSCDFVMMHCTFWGKKWPLEALVPLGGLHHPLLASYTHTCSTFKGRFDVLAFYFMLEAILRVRLRPIHLLSWI